MTTYNRAQTINSLAMAMGVKPVSQQDLNRYDNSRGTLYCKNNKREAVDNTGSAIAYFETMKKSALRSVSAESQIIAGYYTSAIEALRLVQQRTAEETNKTAV